MEQVNDSSAQRAFERGCLVHFTASQWGGMKKISKEIIEEKMGEGKSKMVKGSKNLVDPEELKPITSIVGKARIYLKTYAMPFPMGGFNFVSRSNIGMIDAKLNEFKAEYDEKVQLFIPKYPRLRLEAEKILGPELYRMGDYPADCDIEQRFGFQWRFLTVGLPKNINGDGVGVLDPELYEKAKLNFMRDMEDTKNLCLNELVSRFRGLCNHLIERLTPDLDGRPKNFRESTLSNFNAFFELYQHYKEVIAYEPLNSIIEETKAIVNKVPYENLKTFEPLQETVKEKFEKLGERLDDEVEIAPVRSLVFD